MEKIHGYKVHPAATLFPLIEDKEFDELVNSIKQNGLLHPIVVTHDMSTIVDGRNRLRACHEAGAEPKFEPLGKDYTDAAIVQYIWSSNINRRHLNTGQRAMIVQELAPMLEEAAKERMLAGKKADDPPAKLPEGKGEVREQLAAKADVSPRTISKAKKIKAHSPELAESVRTGKTSLENAMKQVKGAAKSEPKKASKKAPADYPSEPIVKPHLDEGKSVAEIARATGLSDRDVRSAADRILLKKEAAEKALLEAAVKKEDLSLTAQKKLETLVKKHKKMLDDSFKQRVEDEIRKRLEESILPSLKARQERYDRITNMHKGLLSKAMFQKILSCLHPDSRNSASDEKLNEAFQAFKKLDVELVAKGSDSVVTPFPTTAAELMELRRKRSRPSAAA